jgi:hypothetical protein
LVVFGFMGLKILDFSEMVEVDGVWLCAEGAKVFCASKLFQENRLKEVILERG